MSSTSNPANTPALHGHEGEQQHHQDHHDMEMKKMMMKEERRSMDIPPGWRFHPTDEELINFYLSNKIANSKNPIKYPLHVNRRIVDLDLYKFHPKKLADYFQLPEDPAGMFFFTPRKVKYQNGTRPDRTANEGYWKATGADRTIKENGRIVGYRNTLVFYEGKQKQGKKTNWIMQEYILEKKTVPKKNRAPGDKELDPWVLCKVYENRNKNKQNKSDEANKVADDNGEEETSSSSRRSQAQEDQALPFIHNPLPPPPNINSASSSFSNPAGQYNMNYHSCYPFNNGSMTQSGSINGFGVHQEVTNLTSMSHAQQETPVPLLQRTNINNNQGGHLFNGNTQYHQSTEFGFGAQSVPIYNNVSQLDNNGSGMVPMHAMENQYFLDEPLPDFGFSLDDIDEVVPFGMPVEYAKPLSPSPLIDPLTQRTKTDGKSTLE